MRKKLLWTMLVGLLVFVAVYNVQNNNAYESNRLIRNTDSEYTSKGYDGYLNQNEALLLFEALDGLDTLATLEGGKEVTVVVSKNLLEGQAKIVIVNAFGQVKEINETQTIYLESGCNYIKIVTQDATGTIGLAIEASQEVQFHSVLE